MKKISLLLLIISFVKLNAQSFIGHTVDNYAGISSLIDNPSNVVDSRFRANINILSLSAFGGSDYFGINVSDIIKSNGGFDFETDAEKFPSNANKFFVNVDVLGPSFMFNLSPKNSMGVVSRVRAFLNVNNINGELYENIANDFDLDEDFDFNSKNLTGTVHAWAEIGLVYGRVFLNKEQNFLKGGVTLKYLQGAGGLFISSPNVTGQYTTNNNQLITTGTLVYGTSNNFDNEDINFSNLSAGFGADIGFTYEWRPNMVRDSLTSKKQNKCKLKLGVSITDIGSINYKESTITNYDLNATVDASTFNNGTEDFLDNNYTSSETTLPQKIKLPTAFHFLADYQIKSKLYLSFQSNIALTERNISSANTIINSVIIAPRLETKYFSLYSPVSFRQYGDLSWGAGFRLGPVSIGSGSVLTNLLSKTSKTTDVYFTGTINLFQK